MSRKTKAPATGRKHKPILGHRKGRRVAGGVEVGDKGARARVGE